MLKPNFKASIKRAPGLAVGSALGAYAVGKLHKGVSEKAPFKDANQAGIVCTAVGLLLCGQKGMISEAGAGLFAVGVGQLIKKPLGITGPDDFDINGLADDIYGIEDGVGAGEDFINGIEGDDDL